MNIHNIFKILKVYKISIINTYENTKMHVNINICVYTYKTQRTNVGEKKIPTDLKSPGADLSCTEAPIPHGRAQIRPPRIPHGRASIHAASSICLLSLMRRLLHPPPNHTPAKQGRE